MPGLAHPVKNPSSPFASARSHHCAVRVADYESALRWYVEKLDLRVVREWPWEDLRLAYLALPDDDDFYLEIMGGGRTEPVRGYANVMDSTKYPGYHHICLRVASVDGTLAELRRRGVDILGEPFEIPEVNARFVVFTDPWGNQIELTQSLA